LSTAELTRILSDTNRHNGATKFNLSPLQTNQVHGYCGKMDAAYDADEVLDFNEGLTLVSKEYQDVCLYIDGYLNGSDWHGQIMGAPELVITKNLVKVIKDMAPQRSGCAYFECHLGLTLTVVTLMSREAATSILEDHNNLDQSQVRLAADVKLSKGLAPLFSATVDELMGWLVN
jgi:hypothetical protein